MWQWLGLLTAPYLVRELELTKDLLREAVNQNKTYERMIRDYLKGGPMSDIAKAGLTQLVDVVDNASRAAIVAAQATVDSVAATATAAINVGDKTLDVALEEAETLRQQYVESLRRITDAVAGAVPTP